DRAVAWLAGWVGFTPAMAGAGPGPAVYHGPIMLLAAIQGVYVAICVVMVLALFCWLYALRPAPEAWKPGLTVAYGAALLQIALWMLVVPGLALLTIATVVKDPARREVLGQLFGRIQGGFGLYLIFALLLGAFAVGVWVHRWFWVRRYDGGY